MQAAADLLAARVCSTSEPAFFYTLTANSKKFCLVHKDLKATYLLMTWEHFCSLCCGCGGITRTYNHSLHSVRHKWQKGSFAEVC